MIDKICEILTLKIQKENPEMEEERLEVIHYGLHLIIGEMPKIFIIFLVSYFLGILPLTVLAYVFLIPYRGSSGGFHLKTHLGCILGTLTFFCGIALLSKYCIVQGNLYYFIAILIWIFGMMMCKLYAPADTENVPIISLRERKKKKLYSYITLTISIIVALFIPNLMISNLIIYGTLFQSISISRFMYKITKNQYGHEVFESL